MVLEVGGMEYNEMKAMVERRFNKLAMCKRGTIETEINRRIEALGPPPYYTSEERAAIDQKIEAKLIKAMTPNKTLFKKHGGYIPGVLESLKERANAIKKDRHVHPGYKKHEEAKARLREEAQTRIAILDVDIQEQVDMFLMKVRDITELPQALLEVEAREW